MTNDFHDGRLSRRRGVDGYRDEAHSQFVKGNSIRQWEEAKRTPQNQDDAPIVTIIKSGVGAKHEHHVTLVYEPMLHYYAACVMEILEFNSRRQVLRGQTLEVTVDSRDTYAFQKAHHLPHVPFIGPPHGTSTVGAPDKGPPGFQSQPFS
jgi:hypothetical protein